MARGQRMAQRTPSPFRTRSVWNKIASTAGLRGGESVSGVWLQPPSAFCWAVMASITSARSPADYPHASSSEASNYVPDVKSCPGLAASQFAAFASQSPTEVDWSLVCSNHLHFSVGSEKSELVANCDHLARLKFFGRFASRLTQETWESGRRPKRRA